MNGETERDLSHDKALFDIGVRVRGYARYLAVTPPGPRSDNATERMGVWRLPTDLGLEHPHLIAVAAGYSDHGIDLLLEEDHYVLALSEKAAGPLAAGTRHFALFAGSEGGGRVGFSAENKFGDFGGDLSPAMARRALSLLDQLDPLIPGLVPEIMTGVYADILLRYYHPGQERINQFGH